MKNSVLIVLVVLVSAFAIYQYDPSVFGLFKEGFTGSVTNAGGAKPNADANYAEPAGLTDANGKATKNMNANAPTVNKGAKNAGMNANSPPTAATPYVTEKAPKAKMPSQGGNVGSAAGTVEKFADLTDYEGPAQFGAAEAPAGCYPRDQLTPSELLPRDMASIWAEQNPMGPGSLKGKNFLSAGALIGVNTVGQSLRNANLQVRSEPPNPQVPVSIFNQSTIAPDISHRPLEIGA